MDFKMEGKAELAGETVVCYLREGTPRSLRSWICSLSLWQCGLGKTLGLDSLSISNQGGTFWKAFKG